ncbi:Two component regulator propeller [Chitinophaga eiseniae]|uniref:Two component regulator propeller n=1 Tax=Chitinophaga eiseniae TaxID=634771 RepID=A0A1T4QT71_9BACT|nr:two-component regulator propeller domain-containing protein [Chitinophaga eiseniae]SKA06478.1 Two component regulator propeller [Chitinophaga eiseniae]
MRYINACVLFLMTVFAFSRAQSQPAGKNAGTQGATTNHGPQKITRNIIQDRKGNIWMAAFDGIFRYDGKSFTNITGKVSSARFFSVLEDSKGNYWFGSIGSGVYYYDGKSFQHFTIGDGLLNNDVVSIYEDKKGNVWFGVFGGVSCYDGKSFRNYIIHGDAMNEDRSGKTFSKRPAYEVNAIIEDKRGRFWFATRGNTFIYDGKTFAVFAHESKPFKNVRSIIEDKKGNIWLGGADGLWRYDGSTFTNFIQKFVGYVMEDKKGNIWTSAERKSSQALALPGYDGKFLYNRAWALSRYDEKSLSDKKPAATELTYQPMFFGILEDDNGNIWFGAVDGVYRYDGNTITRFNQP